MRFFIVLFFSALLLSPSLVFAATSTFTCGADGKSSNTAVTTETESGVFMKGICKVCWDEGNCGLNDFLTLIANVGNYILSIVAGLVFLVYIIGGFFWIIAHGDKGMVDKGKKWIKSATVGLFIVLFAYTGVVALRSAITGEAVSTGYTICSGTETDGQSCAVNSKCSGFSCISTCEKTTSAFCTDAATAATFSSTEYSCSAGTSSCPDITQKCCTPVTTSTTTP